MTEQNSLEERVARHMAGQDWLQDPADDEWWTSRLPKFREDYLAAARRIIGMVRGDDQPTPAAAQEQQPPARGELWSLLDWTFWGSGMGDVFREPLADTMLAAITPEQLETAEKLMQQWHDSGRQPLGRRRYEELNEQLQESQKRLQAVLEAVILWRDRPGGDVGLAIALAGILDTEQPEPPAATALVRVLRECDRLERAVHDNPTHPELAGGYLACLRHIRQAAGVIPSAEEQEANT